MHDIMYCDNSSYPFSVMAAWPAQCALSLWPTGLETVYYLQLQIRGVMAGGGQCIIKMLL